MAGGQWPHQRAVPLPASSAAVSAHVWAAVSAHVPTGQPGGAVVNQGFFFDSTLADSSSVIVTDSGTPANDYTGPLEGIAAATFATPKLLVQEDGSLRYQPHNSVLQSADFNTTWTRANCTATAGQVGPDGVSTDATLLTATSTSAYINQPVALLANWQRTAAFVVKAGTAGWVCLYLSDGAGVMRAWFNLANGTVGTVESGITAAISAVDDDGNAYAAGYYHVSITGRIAAASSNLRLYPCNGDASVTVTNGHTVLLSRAQVTRGAKRLPYMATTTAARIGPSYEYVDGVRQLRLQTGLQYRGRASDDLTNATYWTLTNATAALNATGPHGEPCSTLTATSANGVASQPVTSAGTEQSFFAYARRKTGAGTLEMSMDAGGTWTDVTSSVGPAAGTYGLIYVLGALANPTVQFRIATSGDEFEIALANVSNRWAIPVPVPSVAADFTASVDTFSISTSLIPTASAMTVFADVTLSPDGGVGSRTRIGFFGAASAEASVSLYSRLGVGEVVVEHRTHDGTLRTLNVGSDTRGRMQVAHVIKDNDYSMTYNGNAAWWNTVPNSITPTSFGISISEDIWVRRLAMVPREVSSDNDDLRLFMLDTAAATVNSNLLASAFVYKFGSEANTDNARIPALEVLSVSGDEVDFITFFGLRYVSGYNAEAPQKAMQRKWRFNRATDTLTPLTGNVVTFLPPLWSTGVAGVQGYTPIKLRNGPYEGRLVLLLMRQDSVSGTGTDDARNLYVMLSDDDGDTWTEPVKFLDKSVFIGAGNGFVATGENSTIFQTDTGRVYFSLNANNQNHYACWTDDFATGGDGSGENWTYSTTPVTSTSGGFGTLSEPALSFWPDGTLVMTLRNTGGGDNPYSTSTDGGVTFAVAQLIGGDNTTWNVNVGLVQADPDGTTGTYGRLVYARSTLNGRTGHKVQSATDAALTMGDNYQLFSANRFIGYCPIKKAFPDDDIFLCMAEVQPDVISNVSTSQMIVAFRYAP